MKRGIARLGCGLMLGLASTLVGCASQHDEEEYAPPRKHKQSLVDVDVNTIDQNWRILVDEDDDDWRVIVRDQARDKTYADVKVDD